MRSVDLKKKAGLRTVSKIGDGYEDIVLMAKQIER